MSRSRALTTTIRLLAGLGGLVLIGGAIAASSVVNVEGPQAEPPSVEVTPEPHDQTWVCPGAVSTLGAAGDETDQVDPVGSPRVVTAGDDLTEQALASDDGASDDAAARTVTAPAPSDPTDRVQAAAAQSQWVDDDQLRGLAAASCSPPSLDSWLVGGSTQGGETTLLVIANPADVPADVDTTVYSEGSEPTSSTVTVADGEYTVVPLAGQSPDNDAPVVHVSSSGGRVSAWLQHSRVTGITPDGLGWVDAGPGPSTQLTVPGVTVRDAESAAEGDDPVVRLAVPGETDASVTVSVAPVGSGAGLVREATVDARSTMEIPLDGLADGSYTVSVASSEPIVAGVHTVSSVEGARDDAWFSAAPALANTAAVAATGAGTLFVANGGDEARDVTLTDAGGRETAKTVEPGTSAAFPLARRGQYTLEQASGLVAAVTYADEASLASHPVVGPTAPAAALTIYPR